MAPVAETPVAEEEEQEPVVPAAESDELGESGGVLAPPPLSGEATEHPAAATPGPAEPVAPEATARRRRLGPGRPEPARRTPAGRAFPRSPWAPLARDPAAARLVAHLRAPRPLTHEALVVRRGRRSGLYTIVAVHSTARGPSLGGPHGTYGDTREAVRDALRLSRAMASEWAVAGLPLGGGKGVIMLPAGQPAPDGDDRRAVLLDFADTVEMLDGSDLTAEDVGTRAGHGDDREITRHVTGLSTSAAAG